MSDTSRCVYHSVRVLPPYRNAAAKMECDLCRAEGYFSDREIRDFTRGPRVQLVDVTATIQPLLNVLRRDPAALYQLSADDFELLVCDRLSHMGLSVQRVRSVYARDGGVDIIACPSAVVSFPYVIAVQAKHHRTAQQRTGVKVVRELVGVVSQPYFNAGLLVTNTTFTPAVERYTQDVAKLIRLRDFKDLQRWIRGAFLDGQEWREIPDVIELGPGIKVPIPKPPSS